MKENTSLNLMVRGRDQECGGYDPPVRVRWPQTHEPQKATHRDLVRRPRNIFAVQMPPINVAYGTKIPRAGAQQCLRGVLYRGIRP